MLGFLFPCEGDANLDELVNIQDIVLTISYILGVELLEDENFSNSDVNNDEVVDVLDIIIIVGIVLSDDNECNETHLDLSLEWEFSEDLSYFDYEELQNIINNQIEELNVLNDVGLEGIIIIHNGKIVSEEYYDGSSISEVYNIWSVTKSFTSTLIGQAIGQGLIEVGEDVSLDDLLPDYGQPYLEVNHLNSSLHLLQ
jgi:hypothetical protein